MAGRHRLPTRGDVLAAAFKRWVFALYLSIMVVYG